MSIRDFFKAAGFREEDHIVGSTKSANGENWHPIPRTVQEYCDFVEQGNLLELNYYYSHATHNGEIKKNGLASISEDSFREIVCLVIDIDYGPTHHEAYYATRQDAQEAIRSLPPPTVLIHSGGGFQLVYRFRSRIHGDDGKLKYKAVYKALESQVHSDSCQGIGHAFRLPFTNNYKEGIPARPVEILGTHPECDYTLSELEAWCKEHRLPLEPDGMRKHKRISIQKAKKQTKPANKDNSRKAFVLIDNFLRGNPGLTERRVLAWMKKQPCYKHYSASGENAEKYCRQDIQRIRLKLKKKKRPKPFTKTKKLKYAGEPISAEATAARERFNTLYDTSGNERITIALSLMEKLYLQKEKAILNFPCASGKTTAAMILTAAYASPENRIWIVTQKIEDVKRLAESLRKIGCNAQEWHGRSSDCPVNRLEFISKKRGFFCRNCETPCTARHKYLARNIWDSSSADVLVTTHSHWAAALIQDKIPESVKCVIVDESPSLMEYFTLEEEKISTFHQLLSSDSSIKSQFDNDMNYIRDMLADGSCHKIPSLNTIRDAENIRKYLYTLMSRRMIPSDTFEQMQIFLDFFASPEIYGMQEHVSGKVVMTFIRGTVNLQTSIPHLILDGSALMSDVRWEGFHIFNCPELKQVYPNTTIDIINGNPSKAFLSHGENFDQLADAVLRVVEPGNTLLLFHNKELKNDTELTANIDSLRSKLREEKSVELLELNRGEHIGSNKGRKAQVNAICMSLFNTLSYYVLRTALVYHREIPAAEIWRKVFSIPAMKRNGGFVSEEIEATYCRAIVLDLYQTIMRGCIRDNPANHYRVVCALSGLDIISVLKEELPEAVFHYENAEVVNALLNGAKDSEIIQLMPSEINERRRYERLAVIRRAVGV